MSKYFVAALAVLLSLTADSQVFNHRFRHWSSGQGLGVTSVLSIAKGADGYLWVGTSNGLQPFNGSRFHNASFTGHTEALSGKFNVLHAASDGRIWAGVNQVGIAMFAPEAKDSGWQWYPFGSANDNTWPISAVVRAIQSDPLGNIWLATENEGLFSLNPGIGTTRKINIDSAKVKFFKSIRSLHLLDSSTMLVGMVNNLVLLNLKSGAVNYPGVKYAESLYQPSYWDFERLNADTLLVGTDRGLFLLNTLNWRLSRYNSPANSTFKEDIAINRVLHFSNKECWLGTDRQGLLFLNLQTGDWGSALKAKEEGIASARINDITRDSDGFIWVAHELGLSCYDPAYNLIVSHPVPELQSFGEQVLATTTSAGDIWYPGSNGIGKFSMRENNDSYTHTSFPPGLRHRQQMFWHPRYGPVLITRSGIWQVDTLGWDFRPLITWNGIDPELPSVGKGMDTMIGRANHIFIETTGQKERWWIAHAEMHRLPCFLPAEQRMVYYRSLDLTANSLTYGTELNRFAQDTKGGLWIASQTRGLFYLPDPNVDSSLNFWNGTSGARRFPFNTVKDLYFDKTLQQLWATVPGTGLVRIDWRKTDSLRYEIFGKANGLQHTGLLRIVPFGENYFFISSTNGIHAFDRNARRFYLYKWRFGLKYGMFFSGFGAYNGGRSWFAVPGNFVSFDPGELLNARRYVPQLRMYVWRDGRREPVNGISTPVRLAFESRDLLVEPDLIDFQQGGNYHFQYRLEGHDPNWITVPAGTQIAYSALPGGKYRFECRLLDGAEQVGALYTFRLEVSTPFYRSPLFFLVLLALLFAGAFARLRHLQQQKVLTLKHQNELLLMQNENQQSLARERERITADLHDDVGATLSSLSIYGDLAGKVWDSQPEKGKEMVDKIREQSRDLMERMSDIIWSMKTPKEEKQSFTFRIKNHGTDLLASKDMNVIYEIDEQLAKNILQPEIRKNLLMIVKESMNNIAKHSQANKVKIQLLSEQDDLVLKISDDGKGFDTQNLQKGNGLGNMEQRCLKINGKFILESVNGLGTQITCRVPMTRISLIDKQK